MKNFLKRIFAKKEYTSSSNDNNEERQDSSIKISEALVTGEKIQQEICQVSEKFKKPENYTGHRDLYDDGPTKMRVKKEAFANDKTVRDPYTNEELVLTKKEAKARFGEEWQNHLAEADHIIPIEQVHKQTKDNPWIHNKDIREIANNDDNVENVSRRFNNAKRSKTNEEFVNDEAYLKKTGVKLSKSGKKKAEERGRASQEAINKKVKQRSFSNAISSGHEAGINTAEAAGTMTASVSSIQNAISVIKGEKSVDEALADVAKDTAKSAAIGYAMGGGGTIIAQTLSSSSSKFIQALVKSNVPGQVISAVIATGDIFKNYLDGKLTTERFITEIGQRSVGLTAVGYSMGVGQSLIPIPVVGAAVGAVVGSVISNFIYVDVYSREAEINASKERAEFYRQLEIEAIEYRKELQYYLQKYFGEYRNCCDEALLEIKYAFNSGDVNGVIAGTNKITQASGGVVHYNNMKEFENYMNDDRTDYL